MEQLKLKHAQMDKKRSYMTMKEVASSTVMTESILATAAIRLKKEEI